MNSVLSQKHLRSKSEISDTSDKKSKNNFDNSSEKGSSQDKILDKTVLRVKGESISRKKSSDTEEESSDTKEESSDTEEESSDTEEETSDSNEESSDSNEESSDSNEESSDSNEESSDSKKEVSTSLKNSTSSQNLLDQKTLFSAIPKKPYQLDNNMKEILRLLGENSKNWEHRSDDGLNPLEHAVQFSVVSVVRYLLRFKPPRSIMHQALI